MAFSTAESLIYGATKLSTFKGQTPVATGTGFFYNVHVGPEGHANLVITNKHVFENADRMTITFHVADATGQAPSGKVITWSFDLSPGQVVMHPDPDVDLCALNIATPLGEMRQQGTRAFFIPSSKQHLPKTADWESFDAVEEVLMIGCPNGIYDQANNIPIVRRGITATSLLQFYNGRQEFLVDIACYSGSSGSPIWLYDDDGYRDRKTGKWMEGAQRLFLVGVLYAGPMIRADGAIITASGQISGAVAVSTRMHLANCIMATEISALEDEFLKMRAAATARIAAREKEKKAGKKP